VLNEMLLVRHVRPQAFRQDELASIPVETSAGKNKLGAAIEIFHVIIRQLGSFPGHGLPAVEQCDAASYQSDEHSDVRDCCRGFIRHWCLQYPHAKAVSYSWCYT